MEHIAGVRWGGYPRISEDPNDTRSGVSRQIKDITEAIVRRGGDPESIRWHVENDTSAYKKKRVTVRDPLGNDYHAYRVIRPEWHQALADLRSGVITALMVWDLDRLARDPRDLEDGIEVVQYYGARIEGCIPGSIDLTHDGGIAMARVLVAMNNKSSADTGRRVRRAHLESAKTGKPVGGYRPFGWKDDKATLEPAEAELVRQAVAEVIAGKPLRSIVRRWNAEGVQTTAGQPWQPGTLRQYLRNPRLVGHRTYQRKVLLDAEGHPVRGLWEPLLSPLEWDQLQTVLRKPEGRYRIPRRGARHYFLTGLIRCGQCSALMYGNRYAEGRHYYTCHDGKDHTVTISGVGADRLVGKLILARLASESLEATSSSQWHGEARLAEIGTQIDALMAAFLKSTISAEVAFPRVQALEEERATMQNDRAQWLAESVGPAVQKLSQGQWEELDTDEQRAHAERWLEAVLVKPATQQQRGNRMSAERLVPVWRGLSGERHLAAVPS